MIIQESQLNYPSIQFFAQTPFMINRKLFKLLLLRIEEKLERIREINTEKKTILILVARGTKT